jgi:hypothetical protein
LYRCHCSNSNKNGVYALTAMPKKSLPSDKIGPMGMQPVEHSPLPTLMLPLMPAAKGGTKQAAKRPPAAQKQQTRKEAVRAVLARITRRNSLRKQRDAQKR